MFKTNTPPPPTPPPPKEGEEIGGGGEHQLPNLFTRLSFASQNFGGLPNLLTLNPKQEVFRFKILD